MKARLFLILVLFASLTILAGKAGAKPMLPVTITLLHPGTSLVNTKSVSSLGSSATEQTAIGITTRVSVTSNGTQANRQSVNPSISTDGRFVAFYSYASNLVSDDTNTCTGFYDPGQCPDIFVHDQLTGSTSRVSVSSSGVQANDRSYLPAISSDGRFVAFQSYADNLVGGDTNDAGDIFVHDRQTGLTQRVSVASGGGQADRRSTSAAISSDGLFIAFDSWATNLVAGDTNDSSDIFVHDRNTGKTTRVSVASNGSQGNSDSSLQPAISADGRYVVFSSSATNLVIGDTNNVRDVFVHDRSTGETKRISVGLGSIESNDNSGSPDISGDGRYIVYYSAASNLVSGDSNSEGDIFVYNRDTGHNTIVSLATDGTQGNDWSGNPTISHDGRYVGFESRANNLVSGDSNDRTDVFVHDREAGQTTRVSVSSTGEQANSYSNNSVLSSSGHYIAFGNAADNLVTGDTNGVGDIFVHDRLGLCSTATATQPVLLVTGWGGSVNETLQSDEQLYSFEEWLGNHGYVEGCNLFYAVDTSPYRFLYDDAQSMGGRSNATVIRDNLCNYFNTAEQIIPGWTGHFDIIAHSYGGLRARAYLERDDLYGSVCPGTQSRVYVDDLFTMGTPHGGEWGDLPFATLIGLDAIVDFEWPALREMLPSVRLWQNLASEQADDVNYHLLAGDARLQAAVLPTTLLPIYWYWPFDTVRENANDFAVHESSAHQLSSSYLSWLYPNTNPIPTQDLHGQVPDLIDPLNLLRSFVNPDTTFESEICPRIGLPDCQPTIVLNQSNDSNLQTVPGSVVEMVEQQNQPQQVTTAPLMDIQAGALTNSDVVTGQFEMSGSGESQISLYWSGGDVDLALADPLGTTIDSQSVGSDPNIDYLSLNTGFGSMSSYQITSTLTGTWTYTITANALSETAGYRLLAVPSTPIAVGGSVSEWLPNNSPAIITATVSYSATMPVVGGSVTARILRPDDTTDIITLFDDGNNQDGAANDGVFGATYSQTSLGGFYGILFTATGSYNSEAYERTATAFLAIAPDNTSLNGQYSDSGIDDDGNNLYEWLEVSVGLTVTEVSTYTLSAELYAGSTFITQASVQVGLEPGVQTAALRFDGDAIRQQQSDGPYLVRNVMLLDESQVTLLIEAADNVHTTAAYSYLQFGSDYDLFLPAIIRD